MTDDNGKTTMPASISFSPDTLHRLRNMVTEIRTSGGEIHDTRAVPVLLAEILAEYTNLPASVGQLAQAITPVWT